MPKVSIISTTYNHEKYIRAALDSFVAQKTDFEVEVIIGDDHSTDNTAGIIEEYAKAHPGLFKPVLRNKNLGVVGNFLDVLRAAKGDYIAICEGDDFWTDPDKLQTQADFLDKNLDYALCFHPVKVFYEGGQGDDRIYPDFKDKSKFSVAELLRGNYIQTNSVMYRRQDYADMPAGILPLDWYLHLYHAQFGKIGFIDKVMAAYRRHPGGLWWESDRNATEIWRKHGLAQLKLYAEFLKLYGDKDEYREIINGHISNMFNNLIEVDKKHGDKLVDKAMLEFPGGAKVFIANQHRELRELREELRRRDTRITGLEDENQHKDRLLQHKDDELKTIKASRFWKLRNLVAGLLGKSVV